MIPLANSYKRISWGNGPVTADKLNAMVQNTDYLYERMMRGHVEVSGLVVDKNVRIQGILVAIQNNINGVSRFSNVYWPKPFTPGCIPIITYGHYFTEAIIHSVGFKNINGTMFPSSTGFRMEVFAPTSEYGDEFRGQHLYSCMGLGF